METKQKEKRLTKKERERLAEIMEGELAHNNITVKRWRTTSSGRAWADTRQIEIPRPTNLDRMGVVLHEIGHVVLGHGKKDRTPSYVQEYEAEWFAIEKLKEYNLPFEAHERRALRYVAYKLAKAHNRGAKHIPSDVIDWLGIDYTSWRGLKIEVAGLNVFKRRVLPSGDYYMLDRIGTLIPHNQRSANPVESVRRGEGVPVR